MNPRMGWQLDAHTNSTWSPTTASLFKPRCYRLLSHMDPFYLPLPPSPCLPPPGPQHHGALLQQGAVPRGLSPDICLSS